VESVYSELARALITREPTVPFPLDHIGFTHSLQHPQREKWPSWVPDWNPSLGDIQFLANYDRWVSPFCADDYILDHLPWLLAHLLAMKPWRRDQLPILGVEFGHLTHLGQYSDPEELGTFSKMTDLIKKWTGLGLGPDYTESDLMRVNRSDRLEDGRTRLPGSLEVIESKVFASIRDWKLGRTSGKNLVLVPPNARKKDLICVPVGSSTPFVLRATDKKDDDGRMQYHLVGRCYVHKFMDGEAMAGVQEALKNAERSKVSDEEKREIFFAQLKLFILI
jgi:hypothetical protein